MIDYVMCGIIVLVLISVLYTDLCKSQEGNSLYGSALNY